jgi:hypothetical protein
MKVIHLDFRNKTRKVECEHVWVPVRVSMERKRSHEIVYRCLWCKDKRDELQEAK